MEPWKTHEPQVIGPLVPSRSFFGLFAHGLRIGPRNGTPPGPKRLLSHAPTFDHVFSVVHQAIRLCWGRGPPGPFPWTFPLLELVSQLGCWSSFRSRCDVNDYFILYYEGHGTVLRDPDFQAGPVVRMTAERTGECTPVRARAGPVNPGRPGPQEPKQDS